MTARQRLGDLIRSLAFPNVKCDDEEELESSSKLTSLKYECKEEEDMSFDELKDAHEAFEKKVCIKGFPEADTEGYNVACTAADVLEELMSDFLEENDGKIKLGAEIRFHTLMALFKAGPNSSHVALMYNWTDNESELKTYTKGLEKTDVIQILKTLTIQFKYPSNKECDEDVYSSTLGSRIEKILTAISKKQYKLVQKEFLELYYYYNAQIPTLSETFGKHIYSLVRNMVENYEDENPYLHLKDLVIIKKHLSLVQELVCCKSYKNEGPLDDAAKCMMERILVATVRDEMVTDLFDHIMKVVIAIYKNENASREAGDVVSKVRLYLIREIEERELPVKGLFTASLNMLLAIFERELSDDARLMVEDVVNIVVKVAKPLSEDDVKQVLAVVSGIVMSGRRDLVIQIKGILIELKKQRALDWKKHVGEARRIIEAIGKVPVKNIKDDGCLDRTIMEYNDFVEDFLNIISKSEILPQVQSSLVSLFFSCIQDSTLIKMSFAEASARVDFMDFSKEKSSRLEVLRKCESMLKDESLPWEEHKLIWAVGNIINVVANSYSSNGKSVTAEENKLFMSIFKIVSDGGKSVVDHWYQAAYEERPNVNLAIWKLALRSYVDLHQQSATLACISSLMPNLIRWTKIALKEKHSDMFSLTTSILSTVGQTPPKEFSCYLPDMLDLLLKSEKCQDLYNFVSQLYPQNPTEVHNRMTDMFNGLDRFKDNDMNNIGWILHVISEQHPEAFSKVHIERIFDRYKKGGQQEKMIMLMIIKNISEKHPSHLVDFFPQLCDGSVFKSDSMALRSGIFASLGTVSQECGQKAIDHLLKHALFADPPVVQVVVATLHSMVRLSKENQEYMQQYKPKFEKLEKTTKITQVKEMVHEIILILEGKTFESVIEDVQQQKEGMAALDVKVDATRDTVITIGDKVIEHDKEIGELGEGLEKITERVSDVEEDISDTKVKVEEIDSKTMSNAPKWSRDLTKLMNPVAEADWRLLASRLGYSKNDIRSWATQHDPCMALLSEWYATHKTSEASYSMLTALTEMDRMDGVAIVENAMKAADGVVEDNEFEYPSPPPIFISYQWGIQNKVKLLKKHLNMAGYECWMDIGQMGGGDKLFAKIDNGIRGAKVVVCCMTEKYAQSPNCIREVNLSTNLNKPIIPLLMEKTDWPPMGSMGPIFSEYLFVRFYQRAGEETKNKDGRYWPVPKFQELLMQLNYSVVPDQKMITKEYKNWWLPIAEDILIETEKGKKQTSNKSQQNKHQVVKANEAPMVFLSYQWGKQLQIKALYQRLTSMGYTVWMDIYQMGGGDSLYDKIDRGIRGCKAVVSCITEKYSLSANCRREVSLADALKKPIIPLLLERIKWPPAGPMSMVFTEMLFINFYRNEAAQMVWKGDNFEELIEQLNQYLPYINSSVKTTDQHNAPVTKVKGDISHKGKDPLASKKAHNKEQHNSDGIVDKKKSDKIVANNSVDDTKESKKPLMKEPAKPKSNNDVKEGNKSEISKPGAEKRIMSKNNHSKRETANEGNKSPSPRSKSPEERYADADLQKRKTSGKNEYISKNDSVQSSRNDRQQTSKACLLL